MEKSKCPTNSHKNDKPWLKKQTCLSQSVAIFSNLLFITVLTKMQNELKQHETTWNSLQQARNYLKRPKPTYHEQQKRPKNTNNKPILRL